MDQHYDDFTESAQNATDKGGFLKLPRYQKNLKYNVDGLSNDSTKITHLDLPTRTIVKFGTSGGPQQAPHTTTTPGLSRRITMDSGINVKRVCKSTWCDS